MTRSLILLLTVLLLGSVKVSAQEKAALSGPVLKPELLNLQEQADFQPLSIRDFNPGNSTQSTGSFLEYPRTKPGVAFFASAIVPGSGQAANGKWVRAGIYFATEVAGIIFHLDRNQKAREQEKAYEAFTHKNWSVMAYAEWLVNYSQMNGLNNGWQQLRDAIQGADPDFSNTTNDWAKVSISLLHRIESQTPFIFEDGSYGSNFSHNLPRYGSQQYYELISKYYQYQPGWKDWYNNLTTAETQTLDMYRYMWNGKDTPNDLFYNGRDQAQAFNDNYRVAGNILKLLLVNHVISAFDAYFTVKLKNSRIEAEADLMKMEQVSLRWHF